MTSTYSNLKFELIGTGDQSGAWGTTTNTNLGTAIEQAIVGMATISSGFTGSPLTLTLTLTDTNAAQNARALVLNLTQSLGSAGTLNVPAIQKPYMIINATGQTVTVKVTGLTGVAVPTGTRAFLYNNGTDVGDFFNYASSLTLGTALPITSGGTGTTSTTFANLTTNVTGTLPVANGGTGAATFTANNVLLGNGTSAFQVVAAGTSGNVLTSNGTTWASTAPVTGAMVYLASVSASASSTIDLFDYFSSTYDTYFITANGIYMSASNSLQIRIRTGTTVQTGSSYSSWSNATGSTYDAAFGIIFEGSPTASTDQTSFYCYITNPNSTTQHKAIYGYAGSYTSTAVSSPVANFNAVWRGDTNALTGVRIYPAAGTITAGTFRLYGIKNS